MTTDYQMIVNKISLVFLVIGLSMFFIGFHNVDGAYNLHYINYKTGMTFVESNTYGKIIQADNLYLQGIQLLFTGMFVTTIGLINLQLFSCQMKTKRSSRRILRK